MDAAKSLQDHLKKWKAEIVEELAKAFHEKVGTVTDDHTKVVAELALLKTKLASLCKRLGDKED